MQTLITLHRLAPGKYHVAGYVVERFEDVDGWRWYNPDNPHQGGEWRRTKRDAVLDLMAHLGMSVEER